MSPSTWSKRFSWKICVWMCCHKIGTAVGALNHVLKAELTRINLLMGNLPSKSLFPKCSITAMPLLGAEPDSSGTESHYICRVAISFISKVRCYNKEEVVALHRTCLWWNLNIGWAKAVSSTIWKIAILLNKVKSEWKQACYDGSLSQHWLSNQCSKCLCIDSTKLKTVSQASKIVASTDHKF